MHPVFSNLLWGLKRGALFALAFALGIGLAALVQGPSAFAAYHPSILEIAVGGLGTWIVGGLLVGLARPLAHSSIGYLVVATIGSAFVAAAVLVAVTGFSYFSFGTTLGIGLLFGQRIWAFHRVSSRSAV